MKIQIRLLVAALLLLPGCAAVGILGAVGLAVLDGASGGFAYKMTEHFLEKDPETVDAGSQDGPRPTQLMTDCTRQWPDGGAIPKPWFLCRYSQDTWIIWEPSEPVSNF